MDAAGDAGPDADESGNVTVAIKGFVSGQTSGAAVADIDVISSLPDGTFLAMAKSDASGNATIKVVPNGFVTAVYKRAAPDLAADLVTIAGVKPGETLEFGNLSISPSGTNTIIGAQSYSWPTAPNGTVQTYRAATSCGSSSVAAPTLSTSFSEASLCNKTPMDVIYVATGPTGLLHCGSRQNLTFSNGANVALGGWQTVGTFIANITGLPPSTGLTNSSLNISLRTVIDGSSLVFLGGGAGSANGVATGGAFTGNMQWCGTGERTVAQLNLFRPGTSSMRIIDSLPSNATSWTVAAPVLPPWLEFQSSASVANQSATWGLLNEGTNASDAVYLALGYDLRINNMSFFGQWHFVLPPNTTSVKFPKLPAAFADLIPNKDLGVFVNRVNTVEIPTVTSYDMIRTMGTGVVFCPDCAVRSGEVQRAIISGN